MCYTTVKTNVLLILIGQEAVLLNQILRLSKYLVRLQLCCVLNKDWKIHIIGYKVEIFAAWRLMYFNGNNLSVVSDLLSHDLSSLVQNFYLSKLFHELYFYNDLSMNQVVLSSLSFRIQDFLYIQHTENKHYWVLSVCSILFSA